MGCVQDAQPKTITVKVNMNGIDQPSQVGIRGTHPLSWDETTYLTDTDNDGIYENTFQIYATSNSIEFKFVNKATEFELQNQNNRNLIFEYRPETIIYEGVFNTSEAVLITRE